MAEEDEKRDLPQDPSKEDWRKEWEEEQRRNQPPLRLERKARNGGGQGFDMGNPLVKMVMVAVVVTLVIVMGMGAMGGGAFVTKSDFTKNIAGMVTTVETASADLVKTKTDIKAEVQTAVAGVPTTINNAMATTVTALNAQIADMSNRVNNFSGTIQSNTNEIIKLVSKTDTANSNIATLNTQINALTTANTALSTKVTSLEAKVTALQTLATAYDVRIKALEATATPTTPTTVSSTIPNVTMTASVIDDGMLQSNNSTVGQIKFTMVNNGTKDISDITFYLYVFVENCGDIDATSIFATYGSWYVRDAYGDELQLKGSISRLDAGDTRRIYIDVTSYAYLYEQGRTTYLDTSSSDIDVVDWNYAD